VKEDADVMLAIDSFSDDDCGGDSRFASHEIELGAIYC